MALRSASTAPERVLTVPARAETEGSSLLRTAPKAEEVKRTAAMVENLMIAGGKIDWKVEADD